ncbi:MAG TPA: serine protease Do [candidate division Zixibacteria bacterium]|nr:serine protease Do [candidate division Zixibacteria bacterium]
MSANNKATVIAIIGGALLGAIFMLVILGYLPGVRNRPVSDIIRPADQRSSDISNDNPGPGFDRSRDNASGNIDTSRRNAIVLAAEKIGPAVVSLSVIQTRNTPMYGSDIWDLFMPPQARQVMSLGSGVIINSKGYVLTNDHVVDGAQEIRVTLENGEEYPGRLVGADPVTDLAVVKIMSDTTKFKNAILGNSDDMIIGEWAIAVGNPFGYLLDDPHPTVTVGVISATNRDIKPERGQKAIYRKMVQTDAAINPGNSGGPLVNALGEVIGINTFIFSSSRGSEGIGFAVPINRAKVVIDDILKYGEVVKAWIGLSVQNITPEIASSLDLKQAKGLVVTSVNANSPAARAGFKVGDVLLSVGKLEMANSGDWDEVVNYSRAGRALPISIVRGSKEISVVVVPDEIPLRLAPHKTDKFGLDVAEITPAVSGYMGLKDRNGVIVLGSDPKTPAYNWGLQEGDIIRRVGNYEIPSINDYIKIVSQIGRGYRVVLTVEREGEVFLIQIFT